MLKSSLSRSLSPISLYLVARAEKNSNPRIFKISRELTAMLDDLKKRNEHVFGGHAISDIAHTFTKQRRTIAKKFGNPRIRKITLHTFRHWKATWL